MPTRDTWSYEYDPESQMYNLWWDDNDRGAIGEVYTEAYAEMIVSDHNKSLSPSTEQELLRDADLFFCDRHGYCGECGEFAGHDRVQGGRGDASNHEPHCSRREVAIQLQVFLAKLIPKTEEVEKP